MGKRLATEALVDEISSSIKNDFANQKFILSFQEYLELVWRNPRRLARNAAQYLKDMIDHFGIVEETFGYGERRRRFKVFEKRGRRTKTSIIGQELAHEQFYEILEQFVRQGRVDKLILLHGPNGSSKTTTADALAASLEAYSALEEGVVYRFNWVFPTDKVGYDGLVEAGASKRIGFGDSGRGARFETFAHLSDEEIMCKIVSEMKENPIFLLPTKERVEFFKRAIRHAEQKDLAEAEVPIHVENGALGAKSKKIFDSLLIAYGGDIRSVFKHVQVERFFFSSRYRTGIATIEPQMHVDAQERQVTLDRNVQNIPPVLQNIRIFEPSGELIDANRGIVEFSDLLKRPIEAFKYLLTTIESNSLNLASRVADLDLVMIASANEKHLDAFKASADWASFKGRFELVRVPYLLSASLEQRIYAEDVKIIERTKSMGPHAIECLARWAVLTRLKQPDIENFGSELRNLVARLDPYQKLALYDGEEIGDEFTEVEKNELKKLCPDIRKEGQGSLAYEGRFGASPRELKMILYFAAQNPKRDCVSAISIFEEIEALTGDRTVFDYLQFESRGGYHDFSEFVRNVKRVYARQFSHELLQALNLFDEEQYEKAFRRYLQHVVAFIKHEKVYNEITHRNEDPDEGMMGEIEALLGESKDKTSVREGVVSKIASWRVDHRDAQLDLRKIFVVELRTMAHNIYESRKDYITKVTEGMFMAESEDYSKLPPEIVEACERTFENLHQKFGYTRKNAWDTLVFSRKFEPSFSAY